MATSAKVETNLMSNASFKTIDDKIINYVFQTGVDSYDDVIQAVNTDIRSMFGIDREALFRDVPALRDIYRLQDNIFN